MPPPLIAQVTATHPPFTVAIPPTTAGRQSRSTNQIVTSRHVARRSFQRLGVLRRFHWDV